MPVKARIPVPRPDRLRVVGGLVVVDGDTDVVVDEATVVVVVGGSVVVDGGTEVVVGGSVVVVDGLVVVDGDIGVVVDEATVVVVGGSVVVVGDTGVVVDEATVVVVVGGLVVVVDGLVVVDGGTEVVVVVLGVFGLVVVVGEHNGVSTVAAFSDRAQAWPEVAFRRPRSKTTKPTRVRPRPILRTPFRTPRGFVAVAMTTLLHRSLPASAFRPRRGRVEGHMSASPCPQPEDVW